MLIWSVVPNQMIWQTTQKNETTTQKMIYIKGVQVVVEPTSAGKGRICQVLSTDPKDFLRPEFAPGQIVNMYQ